MLCKINPTVGGASNEQARAMNFLRAIQAICTAAANTTPSALSQTTATATPSGADVITEVISNTEAGGWANSASTNITSNYTSLGSPYQLDLYQTSGKGTYPYRKLSFRTNPYQTFSGSYTSYPHILVSHGFNTATDASGNYTLGTNMTMPGYGGVTNQYRFDVNYVSNDTNSYTVGGCLMKPGAGEWLIASTSQYFIALSGALGSTGNPGSMMYVGLRTTNAWENQYDDNPPLASVVYDASVNYTTAAGRNASMWCRTIGPTGSVNSNPAWYRINNQTYNEITTGSPDQYGRYIDPLSGSSWWANYTTVQNATYSNGDYYYGNEMQVPMLTGNQGLARACARSGNAVIPPITDPATGTFVPPAFPITFARNKLSSLNPGGTAIGIYKSLGGSDSYMQQFYTPGQTFILNGEGYYPYAIGNDAAHRDLFLIRKA